jgi:hypothetical protein
MAHDTTPPARAPRVILLFGDPQHGKSRLTDTLRSEHGFHVISVDEVYVDFVRTLFPDFYLKVLGNYILQHYESFFKHDSTRRQVWWQHLLNQIAQASAVHPSVVVEGYQLYDCKDAIETTLKQGERRVFQIKMERFGATLEGYELQPQRLTPDEVAALGHK